MDGSSIIPILGVRSGIGVTVGIPLEETVGDNGVDVALFVQADNQITMKYKEAIRKYFIP
jgi:hypothetical protein